MDSTAEMLYHANELVARSGIATTGARPGYYKVIGLILAIASGLFIGVSFVMKKVGLLAANKKYQEVAGEGYGYLKNGWWWGGMTLMIIGEICNFVAYAFVDAILVTPLGALTVVVCAILSAIFLKERLSFVGKVGCFNCIVGSVVIAINAPAQSAVTNIQDMKRLVIAPGFLSYMGVVIVGCLFLALWVAPRYAKKTMMVYISICSLIGGLSVVATQGLGAAIIAQIGGQAQFNNWFLYIVLVFVIATLLTEIIYLNKALNIFNAALVTPTYYVFFTSATIVTSAILFQGFKGTGYQIATVVMGFLQICTGVILLQLSKSAKDVPDTAVFKGDLDQVRTVAEQEEPEYEPRADTLRGGGAIVRALSKKRDEKQMQEAKRLYEEHMQPIGEGEAVEFDGLRRRKTVLESGTTSIVRTKTVHPPLGMTRFPNPEDDSDNDDDSLHPGFFGRLRALSKSSSNKSRPNLRGQNVAMEGLSPTGDTPYVSRLDPANNSSSREHIYGLPPGLRKVEATDDDLDTSYKGVRSETNVHWSTDVDQPAHPRDNNSLAPTPPPHTAKRQFSFQNVFNRNRASSTGSKLSDGGRPTTARSGHSFSKGGSKKGDRATEEERLGLVKGDSRGLLPLAEQPTNSGYSEGDDEEWQRVSPGTRSPPNRPTIRTDTMGTESPTSPRNDKDLEKNPSTGSGPAFL